MSLINYDSIREVYEEKNYKFFEGKWDINLIGIRSRSLVVNEFNDRIGYIINDQFKNPSMMFFSGSTKPGLYWLKNKMGSVNGTATLKENQYRQCWVEGDHKGDYWALDQSDRATFEVYRDNDKDGQFDWNGKIWTDVQGLELHTTSLINHKTKVGAYSAGCQITQNSAHHFIMKEVIKESIKMVGSKYLSYTLLNESDFIR